MVVNASDSFHTADTTQANLDCGADTSNLIESIDMKEFRSLGQGNDDSVHPDAIDVFTEYLPNLEVVEKSSEPSSDTASAPEALPPKSEYKPPFLKPTTETFEIFIELVPNLEDDQSEPSSDTSSEAAEDSDVINMEEPDRPAEHTPR